MNVKLKELYYKEDVITGSKQKFINIACIIGSKQKFINIAEKSLNASIKEINEFLKNQEINQVNKEPAKHMKLKITASPKSFQVDMVCYPIIFLNFHQLYLF